VEEPRHANTPPIIDVKVPVPAGEDWKLIPTMDPATPLGIVGLQTTVMPFSEYDPLVRLAPPFIKDEYPTKVPVAAPLPVMFIYWLTGVGVVMVVASMSFLRLSRVCVTKASEEPVADPR
jgi:hypothetical protein